jgi:hypothetical protein
MYSFASATSPERDDEIARENPTSSRQNRGVHTTRQNTKTNKHARKLKTAQHRNTEPRSSTQDYSRTDDIDEDEAVENAILQLTLEQKHEVRNKLNMNSKKGRMPRGIDGERKPSNGRFSSRSYRTNHEMKKPAGGREPKNLEEPEPTNEETADRKDRWWSGNKNGPRKGRSDPLPNPPSDKDISSGLSSGSGSNNERVSPIKPTVYDGKADLHAFTLYVHQTMDYIRTGRISKRRHVIVAGRFLSGRASEYYISQVAASAEKWTVHDFFSGLFNEIFQQNYLSVIRHEIQLLTQGNQRIRYYATKLNAKYTLLPKESKRAKVLKLWDGLHLETRCELIKKGFNAEITDWDTIVNEAEKIESATDEVACELRRNTEQLQAAKALLAEYTDSPDDGDYDDQDAIDSISEDSEQEDYGDIPVEAQTEPLRAEDSEGTYFDDNDDDVISTNSRSDIISDKLTPQEISQYMREGRCFNCGEHGHIARWCPFHHMRDHDRKYEEDDYEEDEMDSDGNDDFENYYHSEDGAQSSDEGEEYDEYDENRYCWDDRDNDKHSTRYSLNCIMIVSYPDSNEDEKDTPINQYLSAPTSKPNTDPSQTNNKDEQVMTAEALQLAVTGISDELLTTRTCNNISRCYNLEEDLKDSDIVQPLGKCVQNEVEGEWDTQNPSGHSSNKFWNKSGDYLEEASRKLPEPHECKVVAHGLTPSLQNDGTDNPMNVEEALEGNHVIPIALTSGRDERLARVLANSD